MDTTDTEDLIERQDATCHTCAKPFLSAVCRSPFSGGVLARQLHCDPCVEAEQVRVAATRASRRAEQAQGALEAAWAAICPESFRTRLEGGPHDAERFAREQPSLAEVLHHPLGTQGLILRGGTGAGKTRAMFRLLRGYFLQTPRPKIVALTAGQFDREARDAAGKFVLTDWFDRLAGADVLFIDDLGKGRWTPATAGQFWEIVDDRTKRQRPVFLTTNLNGDTLVQSIWLEKDIAEPLLRRLRESCKVIVMKRGEA